MKKLSRQSRPYIALLALLALLLTGQVDGLHLHASDSHDGHADIHLSADAHFVQADDHHAVVPVVNLGAQDDLRHHQPLDDQPFATAKVLAVVLPPIQGPPPTAQPPADFHPRFASRLPPSRAPPLAS